MLDFLTACQDLLGSTRVRRVPDVPSTGALPRDVAGMVEVESADEVQSVVRLANTHSVSLYPISAGKNWGFGSALPVKSGSVILSLRRMNRITEINSTFGYAVVGPGVTQGELTETLRQKNVPWVLDVTGAGRDTSLVGNAIERGIAYHTQRTNNTRHLEVVLGDGTKITTGFQDPRAQQLNHLYPHGVGPDPTGLFFQSRYGIVTSMTVDLMPKTDVCFSVGINVEEENIPALTDALRSLRQQGALEGIPHIANRSRFYSTMVPLMVRRSKKSLTPEAAEAMLKTIFPKEWMLLAVLQGHPGIVRAKAKMVKKALRPLGRVLVMSPWMQYAQRVAGWFFPPLKAVMEATSSIQELPRGIPTDDAQHFLAYLSPKTLFSPPDPDAHPLGFTYLVPLMPADGDTLRRFIKTIPVLGQMTDQEPAITLNMLEGRVMEAVVSVAFDKSDPIKSERVIREGGRWLSSLKDIGAHAYRFHIDHMDQSGPTAGTWADLWKKWGDLCDPQGILSPGRYDPAPK